MESLWQPVVSAWESTGGFLGTLLYLLVYGVPFLLWYRLPQAGRDRVSRFIGKARGRKAFKDMRISEGIKEAVKATQSRVFVVRIGTWKTTDPKYCEEVKRLIEADHIWDWHFFLDKPGADPVGWLHDFFITNEYGLVRPLELNETNATTQVGICQKRDFFQNTHYRSAAQFSGIPEDWDEIIIYGTVEGLRSFPRAANLVKEGDSLNVQGVMYFHYRNHEDMAHIVSPDLRQLQGEVLLQACVQTASEELSLFIDQPEDITSRDREQALRLGNHVLAQGRLPTNPGV